jgi:hypothetical protein
MSAAVANRYPAIDLNLTCSTEEVQVDKSLSRASHPMYFFLSFALALIELQVGDNVQVDIVLQRDIDGADVTPVVTSYYPVPKEEVCLRMCGGEFVILIGLSQGWWVVIGDTATDSLLAIKVRSSSAELCPAATAHALAAFFFWQKPQSFSLLFTDRSRPKNVSCSSCLLSRCGAIMCRDFSLCWR